MYTLKRNFSKYFISVFFFAFTQLLSIIFIFFLLLSKNGVQSKIGLVVLIGGLSILIIYFFIDFLKKVRAFSFDHTHFTFGKNGIAWSELEKIQFKLDEFSKGITEVATILTLKNSETVVLFNKYYDDYPAFFKFINQQPDIQKLIEQQPSIPRIDAIDKSYSKYAWFSNLHVILLICLVYQFLILFVFLPKDSINKPWNLIYVFAFLLCIEILFIGKWLLKIGVHKNILSIRYPVFKFKNYQIEINELIAVKFEYRGRANKFMILIFKDYSEKVFRIDVLHTACINELSQDLKATGLIVIDNISCESINMKANYSFKLGNKKLSKKA
ncbi:MAG: hypothetical protein E6Q89_10075 [Bacteroidia bacterium]|nr:MAG: hypothetical protein E6Q89_10075 [Bacteroidia bacterium]